MLPVYMLHVALDRAPPAVVYAMHAAQCIGCGCSKNTRPSVRGASAMADTPHVTPPPKKHTATTLLPLCSIVHVFVSVSSPSVPCRAL